MSQGVLVSTLCCHSGGPRFRSPPRPGYISLLSFSLRLQDFINSAELSNLFVWLITMASIDLSSAFDVVNVKLLIKRMRTIGLPEDLMKIGRNITSNQLRTINNRINLTDLNDKMPMFKFKMPELKKHFRCKIDKSILLCQY